MNRASKGDSEVGQSRDAALYGAVTASLPHTVVVAFDRELRFRMAYGEALRLNGWSGEEMQGKTPRELMSGAQADVLEPLFRAALDGQRSSLEAGWLDEDRVLLTHVAPIIGGHDLAGVAISVDITDRKRAEQESHRLAAIVEQSDDAIHATNLDGEITAWNRGAERLYGYSASEALGQHVSALAAPDQREVEEATLLGVKAGETARYDTRRCRKDGTLAEVSVTSSPIRDASGRITGTSAIARDVGDRTRLERQLRHLANHDPLTGLLNRRAFEAELSRSVALAGRLGIHAAILVLDVDHFKCVNDTYGHAIGDATLRQFATLLRGRLRATDLLARLGGDEFAVILTGVDVEQARSVAADLLAVLRAHAAVDIEAETVRLTVSAGLAPIEPDRQTSPEELLRLADVALYEAKEAGRDRIAQADAGRLHTPQFKTRLSWAQRIRDALDHDRFVLYEQPIVNLATGARDRAELLLRMRKDATELIAPAAFLPAAERLGLIPAIDNWVIEHALLLLRDEQRAGRHLTLHVNLSGASMSAPELVDRLPSQIANAGIDPTKLAFEITQTAAIEDIGHAQKLVDRLAALGCAIVIDDFGSGFGSFLYLKHLRCDSLKIDGEFVKHLATNTVDRLTIQAIVQIAHGLGKTTVAEWVEDQATLELLKELGADYGQGFHLGRPAKTGPPI